MIMMTRINSAKDRYFSDSGRLKPYRLVSFPTCCDLLNIQFGVPRDPKTMRFSLERDFPTTFTRTPGLF